jgi:hypothetical protein
MARNDAIKMVDLLYLSAILKPADKSPILAKFRRDIKEIVMILITFSYLRDNSLGGEIRE